MKPNEGRLQTGEHILARIIQNKAEDAKVVIARFDKENEGSVDISSHADLRKLGMKDIENDANSIIKKGLAVHKKIISREEAAKEFDLSKIPDNVKDIRIVEVEGFDRRPCKDPHVDNTAEIGYFEVSKTERVGNDRYRFIFRARDLHI